jgi:hypothetical protein
MDEAQDGKLLKFCKQQMGDEAINIVSKARRE